MSHTYIHTYIHYNGGCYFCRQLFYDFVHTTKFDPLLDKALALLLMRLIFQNIFLISKFSYKMNSFLNFLDRNPNFLPVVLKIIASMVMLLASLALSQVIIYYAGMIIGGCLINIFIAVAAVLWAQELEKRDPDSFWAVPFGIAYVTFFSSSLIALGLMAWGYWPK